MQHQTSETMETFIGHIKTPQDALLIFEACRRGQLQRVKRRLSAKERMNIRSGSIFAFDESEAGMRRWTDGRTWSPSRVLGKYTLATSCLVASLLTFYFLSFFENIGSFLTYRELDTKRRPRRSSTQSSPSRIGGGHISCSYKPDGLIKQSFSICTASNQKIHLISYYSKSDVIHGRLTLPSMDPHIGKIVIPKGLYPELNPLDTSGGHSATLHLMMKASMDEQQQQQQQKQQHQKQQSVVDSNSSVTSTDSYYNYNNKRGTVHGQPPSLSSSPLSFCSDDDFFSSSSYTALSTRPRSPSLIITEKLTSPIPTPTPKPPLSLPIQVWKPYFLQSEDTRQLEALKTQLRI
jgi:hypothetical protein